MEQARLARINQLVRLAKERPLTPEEIQERDQLRQEYLADFRRSFKAQLDNTLVEYPDGRRVPFREAGKEKG